VLTSVLTSLVESYEPGRDALHDRDVPERSDSARWLHFVPGGYNPRVMPIYEYRCGGCRRKVTVLTLRVSEAVDPVCEHCGSRDLTRLMSRFAMVKSDDARLDDL